MIKQELKIGTRLYHTGDVANHAGYGTIVRERPSTYGTSYDVEMDDGSELCAEGFLIAREYDGPSGVRICTAAAYDDYQTRKRSIYNERMRDVLGS